MTMLVKIKSYLSRDDFFKLSTDEQRQRAKKYDVYRRYLTEKDFKDKQIGLFDKHSSDALDKDKIEKYSSGLSKTAKESMGIIDDAKKLSRVNHKPSAIDIRNLKKQLAELNNKTSEKPSKETIKKPRRKVEKKSKPNKTDVVLRDYEYYYKTTEGNEQNQIRKEAREYYDKHFKTLTDEQIDRFNKII